MVGSAITNSTVRSGALPRNSSQLSVHLGQIDTYSHHWTYPFGWQGASATVVNMKSPNRFEAGANTGVAQVSCGVLYLESVP